MSEFEVRVSLIKESFLPNLHTAKESKHGVTREIELTVLLVKDANIEVWE